MIRSLVTSLPFRDPLPGGMDARHLVGHREYDQAGVLVRVDPRGWLTAATEPTDGVPHPGAVRTHGQSDQSRTGQAGHGGLASMS
jgi:hypothetical protein